MTEEASSKRSKCRRLLLFAVLLLGACDAETKPSTPAEVPEKSVADWFRQLKHSDSKNLRVAATRRLTMLTVEESREALPTVLDALKDGDSEVRVVAAGILLRMQEQARDSAPVIAGVLEDRDVYVRLTAAQTLFYLKLYPAETVKALFEVIEESDDDKLRDFAARLLYAIDERYLPALPYIQSRLFDDDPDMRVLAVKLVLGFGKDATAARGDIESLRSDPDVRVRDLAKQVLAKLDQG